MKIIRNKYVPFGKFGCMNILGLLFVREYVELNDTIINHEAIHTIQQYEIIIVSALVSLILSNFFTSWWYLIGIFIMPILLYLLAWFIAFIIPPYDRAYIDSPFEREAYSNENNFLYLAKRTWFSVFKYISKKK